MKTRMNIVFSTCIYDSRALTMIEDRSMIIDESCSKLIILPSTYFKSVNILVDVGKARCRFIGTDPKMPQAGAYMHQDPAQF